MTRTWDLVFDPNGTVDTNVLSSNGLCKQADVNSRQSMPFVCLTLSVKVGRDVHARSLERAHTKRRHRADDGLAVRDGASTINTSTRGICARPVAVSGALLAKFGAQALSWLEHEFVTVAAAFEDSWFKPTGTVSDFAGCDLLEHL